MVNPIEPAPVLKGEDARTLGFSFCGRQGGQLGINNGL